MQPIKPPLILKVMLIWLTFLMAILTLQGCKTTKDKHTKDLQQDIQKGEINQAESVLELKMKPGRVFSTVLPEAERPKNAAGDLVRFEEMTTEENITQRLIYYPDGSVDVECMADEIWLRIEDKFNQLKAEQITTDLKETSKTKDRETLPGFTFNFAWALVAVFALWIILKK